MTDERPAEAPDRRLLSPGPLVPPVDPGPTDRARGWVVTLFVTALAQQELRRVVLDGHRVVSQEVLFKNIGRVRDVCSGPDGLLYVALNGPDKIIRLEPVN